MILTSENLLWHDEFVMICFVIARSEAILRLQAVKFIDRKQRRTMLIFTVIITHLESFWLEIQLLIVVGKSFYNAKKKPMKRFAHLF